MLSGPGEIVANREQYRHDFFRCDPAAQVLLGHDKLLGTGQADRDNQPSASLELVDQGRRDQVGRRCDDHFVERGLLGPTGVAVADGDFDVGSPVVSAAYGWTSTGTDSCRGTLAIALRTRSSSAVSPSWAAILSPPAPVRSAQEAYV